VRLERTEPGGERVLVGWYDWTLGGEKKRGLVRGREVLATVGVWLTGKTRTGGSAGRKKQVQTYSKKRGERENQQTVLGD